MILASFIIIILAVVLFSWFKTRKEKTGTLNALFFANRKLGFAAVGCGLLFTNINTASFIGENELSYVNNMSVMAWGITSVLAMQLVSELVIPIYLRTGIATTPDFLELRYDRSVKSIVSLLFLANYIVNLLPAVLYGSAVAFDGLFDISGHLGIGQQATVWLLVWAIGILGTLYALLGGLRALTVSDTVLGFALFTGGLLLPYFALRYLGAGSWQAGLHTLLSSKTEHLNSIGQPGDAIPFGTIFTGMLLVNLYYWGTEQYIVQQALASKDLATCQKGIALAALGKLMLPLLLNIPGVIAAHLYTALPNTSTVFSKLAGDVSPPAYSGYLAALLFGATITTFIAGLNGAASLFVLNIYKPLTAGRRQPSGRHNPVRTAKKFQVLVSIIAMTIAPFILFATGGFYTWLQKIGGLFSVPIFTIMLVGFLTKRVPPLAARAGLFFFIISYGCTQLFFDCPLHFLHVLAILFVITTLLMLLIGRWKPMPVPFELKQNNKVAVQPWKYRRIVGLALVIAAILLFILFSPVGLVKS
ncbi:solute:sodium symporter family transporter [Niabella drilacis]|uniref:Solute:Na+ symporter, SSS family n=1 Tax=Niabella drilacis (strain DSM 25811 / CCM 8410 / CCUG 62505 / LMG 26954 / E90) TaxID=1285928 RepID=A0A1G7C3V9_NIADE|nr:solute:sodium symporter family transporter [Niabella drilacis]SDE33460.1 solute:Na+ symporter, SSS family [Niabella drilacis]